MAARITGASAPIEQTLHGYADGHSLLAGSVELDDDAAALMLVMSDLAPQTSVGSDGWLTGYPLRRGRRYVVSRTWPALEMPRPGCVWTHSLILDPAVLETSGGLRPLLDLLRRPAKDLAGYRTQLEQPMLVSAERLPVALYGTARQVLTDLYGSTQAVSAAVANDEAATRLLCAIWEQQWPQLRRRFQWTTLAAQPSSEVPPFDLTVAPSASRVTERGLPARKARSSQGWAVAALADLRAGGGDIRSELRRMAGDVQAGRRAFSVLVSALLLAKRPHVRSADAQALIALINRRLQPDEGKTAKGAILAALLRNPDRMGSDLLDFGLALLPDLDEPEAVAIARACWRHNRTSFWGRLPESAAGRQAARQIIDELPAADLVEAVREDHAPVDDLVAARPDILREPALWRAGATTLQQLSTLLADRADLRRDAIAGAFALRDAQLAVALAGGGSTADLFEVYAGWEKANGRSDTQRTGFEQAWLAAAATDLAATAAYLGGEFRLRPSVAALARALGPSSFPPAKGDDDLWATAWETCAGRPLLQDREFIAAFFLYRACHFETRRQGEYFAQSFGNLMDHFEGGLNDPGARALVSDHFSQYGFFSLLERDATRVFRAVSYLVSTQDVPIATYIANGRVRQVESFVDQLRWQPGAKGVMERAIRDMGRRHVSKKRIKLLEQALR